MTDATYAQALNAVEARIVHATQAAGRRRADVALLAVSKTHPAAAVQAFYELGLRAFGENYAQELATKATALRQLRDICWSYIGTIQSNKIKLLVTHADEIQSVTTLKQAQAIARYAQELNKNNFSIYLCVNAGDEPSKTGIALADAAALAAQIAETCPRLRLRGLMAIPPPATLPARTPAGTSPPIPPLYRQIAAVAGGIGEGQLSLGMTADLEAAIAAGSTCVRIGTALFGARSKQ